MAIEVELKARVDDPEACGRLVSAIFGPPEAVEKADIYFTGPGSGSAQFRIRTENGKAVLTWKEKTVEAGIEVNNEREFSVPDPISFTEFLKRLGCRESYRKVKTGRRWKSGDVTVELVRVGSLGLFLEIEKLLEVASRADVTAATAEIRELLSRAGIGEEKIERRFYSELLAGGGS